MRVGRSPVTCQKSTNLSIGLTLVASHVDVVAAAARHGDPAVADVVDRGSPWAPYHAYWLSLDSSCDPDQTGAADIVAYNETDEDWPVIAGYGALVAAWAADVRSRSTRRYSASS